MFINRNWNYTANDDFKLHIKDKLSNTIQALPIYIKGQLMGWELTGTYE